MRSGYGRVAGVQPGRDLADRTSLWTGESREVAPIHGPLSYGEDVTIIRWGRIMWSLRQTFRSKWMSTQGMDVSPFLPPLKVG